MNFIKKINNRTSNNYNLESRISSAMNQISSANRNVVTIFQLFFFTRERFENYIQFSTILKFC